MGHHPCPIPIALLGAARRQALESNCACSGRCGQCFYCHHDAWSACSNTNPSKEEEALYGHRTAGFYGATAMPTSTVLSKLLLCAH